MTPRTIILALALLVIGLITYIAYLAQLLDVGLVVSLWVAEVPIGLLIHFITKDPLALTQLAPEKSDDKAVCIAYASITEHLLALEYWTRAWKGSPDALPSWEQYKTQSLPPFSTIKDASVDWERTRRSYDSMVAHAAIVRELESATTKIRALILPEFETKFPEVYKSIMSLSNEHLREESESIFKSVGLPPSWLAGRKALEELNFVMVAAERMQKLFPRDDHVKSKVRGIKQTIDSMMKDIQKWNPGKGKIAY